MQNISLPADSPLLSTEFIYGVATSSFQIEGDRAGRSDNIWDTFCALPAAIEDGSNGDVACEHVKFWQKDVELIAELGVDAYRLSVSWSRVIQSDGSVNQQGLRFYVNLVDALVARGIQVFVTLYHWDLPQTLEDNGGWLNRQTTDAFAFYTSVVAQALGNNVTAYATLNEPFCSAYLGYETGIHAPGKTGVKNGRQAAHHLLVAHGKAMQVLQKVCPNSKHGIVLNFSTCYPASGSAADKRASEFADQYHNHWYLMPLIEGRYPDVIHDLPLEHQPDIAPGDMALIRQPLDYLGVNYYNPTDYAANEHGEAVVVPPNGVPVTAMGWEINPAAFTALLLALHQRYQLPPLYITENGAAMEDRLEQGEIKDDSRIAYYHAHLNAVHHAVVAGVDIKGYFAWSLMDNFEWSLGYTKRFGIVYVDYPTQQRIPKHSAKAYRTLLKTRAK
ncbi:GH1 family beta-glucosidase [Alteromonas sp. C1M14]|uniref:GH1 family beta-glucosidase n=1 Tax=Alteromonas sp. C1M14 TaxID=2841567 RepID=UPI001C09DD45|nr:GH1 family beta-glucosidase [Alteromonas sp. C1M14]MBU2977755.1 beta-glucosidase [Alteromonas sp. C1M14]